MSLLSQTRMPANWPTPERKAQPKQVSDITAFWERHGDSVRILTSILNRWRTTEEAARTLQMTTHGAGRLLSRMQDAGVIDRDTVDRVNMWRLK